MKTNKLSVFCLAGALLLTSVAFTSCLKGDDVDTNQYTGGISLNVFGPSPVARGGELRFLGCGLDQVTAVLIPGCEDITDIQVISSEEIRVIVPQTAEPGYVTLTFGNGESITTKTQLTYSEPISIESFSPTTVRPGDVLTIQGEYLNLIHQVIFADDVVVSDGFTAVEGQDDENVEMSDKFLKHTRNEIQVVVPEEAQTGKIILSDGEELPNLIYSEEELQIVLPSVVEAIDTKNAKPGDLITIDGKNLDLVSKVLVPGNPEDIEVTFECNEEAEQLVFALPDNAADGDVIMLPASGVEIVIAHLSMAKPEVTTTFDTEVQGGQEITLNGNDLDLIASVTFSGVNEPVVPVSSSETTLTVIVPETAVSGTIMLNLKNGDVMNGPVLTVKKKCTVVSLPTEIEAGVTLELSVENGDQLTGVEVNGSSVQYSLQDSKLTFVLPQDLTGTVILKLMSGEDSVTYTIPIVSLGTQIYGESKVLGSSWADYVYLDSSSFMAAQVGQVITVVVSNVQADAQGAFKTTSDGWPEIVEGSGYFTISGNYNLEITQEVLVKLQSTGLVIGGVNYTIESVYIK